MGENIKKVLIIDDRGDYVNFLKEVLEETGKIKITIATKYFSILSQISLDFDVILLNIKIEKISGLDVLYQIMQNNPTPVIVMTGDSDFSSEETLTALKYGAVDFLEINNNMNFLKREREKLIALIKSASLINVKKTFFRKVKELKKVTKSSDKIVVLGSSTGGPSVVTSILESFPEDFPTPIFIIQHMGKNFTRIFASRLNRLCKVVVKEAEHKEEIKKSIAYVAPGGFNLEVSRFGNKNIILLTEKKSSLTPSIDLAISSIAKIYEEKTVAIILTGMGSDGSRGIDLVKKYGGKVIAQNKKSSVVFGMPKVVIEQGNADFVLSENLISKKINELL